MENNTINSNAQVNETSAGVVFDNLEKCIKRLKKTFNEKEIRECIEDFRHEYSKAKAIKSSMTEGQWNVVKGKVDFMKKLIGQRNVQTIPETKYPSPIGKETQTQTQHDFSPTPIIPTKNEYRPKIFLASDATTFAERLAKSQLSDEECIVMADRWLKFYKDKCTPEEIAGVFTCMCNGIIRHRHEDTWQFRWYGDSSLNPKPEEWENVSFEDIESSEPTMGTATTTIITTASSATTTDTDADMTSDTTGSSDHEDEYSLNDDIMNMFKPKEPEPKYKVKSPMDDGNLPF